MVQDKSIYAVSKGYNNLALHGTNIPHSHTSDWEWNSGGVGSEQLLVPVAAQVVLCVAVYRGGGPVVSTELPCLERVLLRVFDGCVSGF